MDFAGLSRVLSWGCERAERRQEKLRERGRGGTKTREDEELFVARVLACRLDASRAAAVAAALTEALEGCEAPAFVCCAIEDARRAAGRALRAAEEALGPAVERETWIKKT